MPQTYSLDDAYAAPATLAPTAQASPSTYSMADAYAAPAAAQPTHAIEKPTGSPLGDLGNFLRTAAIKAASGLLGPTGQAGAIESGQLPEEMPSSAQIEDQAFNSKLGPEYQPQTEGGRLAMGATTGAMSSVVAPEAGPVPMLLNALRGAAAGAAAQGATDLGVSPWLGVAAPLLLELAGRTGVGAVKIGAPGVKAVTGAVTNPSALGVENASKLGATIDHNVPALPPVSDADALAARGGVSAATSNITSQAAPDFAVGQQIRGDLTARADALKGARADAADTGYAAFRQQEATPAAALAPFMSRPSFRAAVGAANGAVLDEGGRPLTDYWDFNEAGDPIRLKNAAVPPDVLDRIRSKLGENVADAAQQGPSAAKTAQTLAGDFDTFLDNQYPATDTYPGYAAVRAGFKENSRPLDALNTGAPAKVLENNRPYGGAPQYTLPAERVPDLFLKGPATKTNLDQLVAAYGGDKAAAEGALEQHLADVVRPAVNPDGTLDAAKFANLIQPYQKTLNGNGGVWFSGLKQRFANAHAAQDTLDTLTAQKSLGEGITNGALRDQTGNVTAQSFDKWLTENKGAIAKAQGPAAVTRLQQLGNALKIAARNGGGVTSIEDVAPAVVGTVTGGADLGILGSMIGGRLTRMLMSPLTTKYAAAFNSTVENIVRDPAAARVLVAKLPKGNYSPLQALRVFGATVKPGLTTAPRMALTTGALSTPMSRTQ